MLRRSPLAALLWCAALIVAVVTAIAVTSTLASLRRQDARYGRVTEFLVAASDLPTGHTVTSDDLRTVRARGAALAPGTLKRRAEASGLVVTSALLRGDAVTRHHLAGRRRDGSDGAVPPGWRAMRVVVEDGIRVRADDHVDVYVTFDPAKVAADVDPTLVVASAARVVATDPAPGSERGSRAGVTLLIVASDARRLAYAAANGVVTLALVPPEEAHDPTPVG